MLVMGAVGIAAIMLQFARTMVIPTLRELIQIRGALAEGNEVDKKQAEIIESLGKNLETSTKHLTEYVRTIDSVLGANHRAWVEHDTFSKGAVAGLDAKMLLVRGDTETIQLRLTKIENLLETQQLVGDTIKPMAEMITAINNSLNHFPETIRKEVETMLPGFVRAVEQKIDDAMHKYIERKKLENGTHGLRSDGDAGGAGSGSTVSAV